MIDLFIVAFKTPYIISNIDTRQNTDNDGIFNAVVKYERELSDSIVKVKREVQEIVLNMIEDIYGSSNNDNDFVCKKCFSLYNIKNKIDNVYGLTFTSYAKSFERFIFYDEIAKNWRMLSYQEPAFYITNYLEPELILRIVDTGSKNFSDKKRKLLETSFGRHYFIEKVETIYSTFEGLFDILESTKNDDNQNNRYAFIIEDNKSIAEFQKLLDNLYNYKFVNAFVISNDQIYKLRKDAGRISFQLIHL